MRKSENLEQVLDILVVLPWQVLVLQEVPHRVKLVISLLNGSTDRCSQTFLFLKGLASHCKAKTTFTFYFFIINA